MPTHSQFDIVISNTTPLIALSLIGQLELLRQLYNTILIPPAVRREMLADLPARPGQADLFNASWLQETRLQSPRNVELLSDLDPGEAEVIVLALEQHADLVIMDERMGRRHATRLGLTVTGTLGVLLRAKAQGLIPRVAPLIEDVVQSGLWIDKRLIAETLRLASEHSE